MTDQELVKVAAYLRVSTEEQTKGFGLDEQREKLAGYCQFKGWEEICWFTDPGYSGGSMNRPGLQALLNAIQQDEVSVVLTYKADRLSRKLKDLLVLIEDELAPRGVAFISATEDFNTATASGKAFFSMLGTFAEFERNVIRDRTLGGRKQKARQGGYAAGEPPLGYEAKDRELLIREDQAVVVRDIFAWRQQGETLQHIAERLNQTGVATKRGGKWYPGTVRYLLENPKYHGLLRHQFAAEVFETAVPHLKIA